MLKIYLDWNCITNIQERHPKLYELIKEYGDFYIFPYSNAHIRDLLVSKNDKNPFYQNDIKTLKRICGKHLLLFDNNITNSLFCFPEDYIDMVGDDLEAIQKKEWLPKQLFQLLKESSRRIFPEDVQKKIQGANPEEVFNIIDEGLKSINPEFTIEKLAIPDFAGISKFMNEEAKFKSLCLALDLSGFRPESKDKLYTNIDTDASHIFYASKCDILVSDDRKMRGKAKAMFSRYRVSTRVLTSNQFEKMFIAEIETEYSLRNIPQIIQEYGQPMDKEDGVHYKIMESPFLGLFNVCMLIDDHYGYTASPNSALFIYCFNTPYLYITELEHLFRVIKDLLPQELAERFQKEYVDELCSRNKKRALNARFSFGISDLNLVFEFSGDPLSPVPCPMLKVQFK